MGGTGPGPPVAHALQSIFVDVGHDILEHTLQDTGWQEGGLGTNRYIGVREQPKQQSVTNQSPIYLYKLWIHGPLPIGEYEIVVERKHIGSIGKVERRGTVEGRRPWSKM